MSTFRTARRRSKNLPDYCTGNTKEKRKGERNPPPPPPRRWRGKIKLERHRYREHHTSLVGARCPTRCRSGRPIAPYKAQAKPSTSPGSGSISHPRRRPRLQKQQGIALRHPHRRSLRERARRRPNWRHHLPARRLRLAALDLWLAGTQSLLSKLRRNLGVGLADQGHRSIP